MVARFRVLTVLRAPLSPLVVRRIFGCAASKVPSFPETRLMEFAKQP